MPKNFLIHQTKCLNTQGSLAVVATLFDSVLWHCHIYTGVLVAIKVVLGQEIFVSKLWVPVSQ